MSKSRAYKYAYRYQNATMAKTAVAWYVVTAEHVEGYTMTWKTRSAARAARLAADAVSDEIKPGSVTVTPPELATRQAAYLARA